MNNKTKIIFLDRDGTVIVNKHYLSKPGQVSFLPGAVQGLLLLQNAGYRLVIVSNQSGVGRGFFTVNDVIKVNERLVKMLDAEGIKIDKINYCPHAPGGGCECRKPEPGMILDALEEFDGDRESCWMIGDNKADILAGKNAGVKTILVRTGYGAEIEKSNEVYPDLVVDDLKEAALAIKKAATE